MAQEKADERPTIDPPTGADHNWQEKIARAKAAREHGRALRAGKPTSFRSAIGRSR